MLILDAVGNALAELNETTGARFRLIQGGRRGLINPVSVASDGRYIWVGNYASASTGQADFVAQISARDGRLIR